MSWTATQLYARASAAVPGLDPLVRPALRRTLDGRLLVDERWLACRVTDTAARWGSHDARVNGTLWWYSASSILVAPAVAALVACGRCPDVHPQGLRLTLASNGYLASTRSERVLPPGTDAAGERLRTALRSVIPRLAAVSGARERALWAITADSVADRCLWAGTATGNVPRAIALGAELAAAIGPELPVPRYVELAGPDGTARQFVRRVSCCLIYKATGEGRCRACPRRHPAERGELLTVAR